MTPEVEPSRPAASHRSAQVRAELRALLVAQQRINAEQAAAHEATARELSGNTDADSVIERELAEVCATRARQALQEAEHALDRLAAGTYGTCEACGAAIPFERLQAIPEARYCVACPGGLPAGEASRAFPARTAAFRKWTSARSQS